MHLVDAIEAWGRAHRSDFDRAQAEALADVWRTVRASEHATLDVATMRKDQARAVMAVFDAEDRASVASTLNKVRKWTIANEAARSDEAAGSGEAGEAVESVEAGESKRPEPGEPERDVVTIDPSPLGPAARETLPASGPVEGWQPPTPVGDPPAAIDQRIILGLVGLVLAVVLIWFLFLRGDDEAQVPVDSGPETVEDVITRTNQAFLDQFELDPDVGDCLVEEFGDLASAATDATLRERQVCGVTLLELITDAS